MNPEDTGVSPETGADNKALNSDTNPQGTQVSDNAAQEVERLRKEAEQAKMRANQLENQLKAKQEAEEAAKAKELEEKEEFKTLYEQEKAARERIEAEKAAEERKAELAKAKNEAFADFPVKVQEIATELGYELTDTDEATVSAFKAKLAKVQESVGEDVKATPNNPGPSRKSADLPQGDDLRLALKDPQAFDDIIANKFPGISAMMTPKQ